LFNPVLAGIVAGGTFLISLIFGMSGRSTLFISLVKAFIFGGVFFGLAAVIYFVFNKFLMPEGKEVNKGEGNGTLGHNIDYSVGDDNLDWAENDDGILDDISKLSAEDALNNKSGMSEESSGYPSEDREILYDEDPLEISAAGLNSASEGVEQNNNNEYSKSGDLARPVNGDASSNDVYSMAMNAAGTNMDVSDDAAPKKVRSEPRASLSKLARDGMVDMSVERRSGTPAPGFELDGKKVAGAIQTLLKKDEG
jgi:hypothetical protein